MRTEQLQAAALSISRVQTFDGAISWLPDGILDPWDHVEGAMGLTAAGRHDTAERAYIWSASSQRTDGAWFANYRGDRVSDETLDANFTAYIAAGVWHHFLATGNIGFLYRMWPVVERAIDFFFPAEAFDLVKSNRLRGGASTSRRIYRVGT